jgi:hypothetical protein
MFEQRWRNIFVMNRNRDVEIAACCVQQPDVAAALVMNIESGSFERNDDLPRL